MSEEAKYSKYRIDHIAKELGENAKAEDILKVMEAVGGVALKLALEEKEGPFGFNKQKEDAEPESTV